MSNPSSSGGPSALRPGTRIAFIVASCLLAIAAYYYLTPTHFVGKDGGVFGCGSPMSPNTDGLAKGQCSILEKVSMNRALLFLAMALLTAILGYLLFSMKPSTGARRERDEIRDEDDDEDDNSFVGRGSRRGRHEDDDVSARVVTRSSTTRPRLGDEDEEPAPRKVRTRLSDDEDVAERRRGGRYDDEAFDSARD